MERLPREIQQPTAKLLVHGLGGWWNATQVQSITHDREAVGRTVHANLMCSPGCQAALRPCEVVPPCARRAVSRECCFAAMIHDGHTFAIALVAADSTLDL